MDFEKFKEIRIVAISEIWCENWAWRDLRTLYIIVTSELTGCCKFFKTKILNRIYAMSKT